MSASAGPPAVGGDEQVPTLTVTQVEGAGPPRVRIALDGIDPDYWQTIVTVYRSADGGVTWDVVQAAWKTPVTGSARWVDYTVPLGVPVIYKAVISSEEDADE